MTTPIAPLDFSGVIPIEFSAQIIEEAIQQSAVLQLANTVPMGTTISEMPVPKTLPAAGFVSVAGRKPYTGLALDTETITAEEIAAVTAIPDVYLEDSTINLWAWVRPRLAEAIAVALDDAILFGIGAPSTFPAGGINAVATATAAGTDAADTVNKAMSAVENQGLNVTGHAADLAVRGTLRGVRDNTGAFLLGTTQNARDRTVPALYGVPISYVSFSQLNPDLFTGNWNALIVGIRQDLRFNMDPSAVVADSTGKVVISGWQDNVTPLKVWARFGAAIVRPVTARMPGGANPFAKADLSSATVPAGVSSVNPVTGPPAGGTVVTVTGRYLTGATGVTFGGTAGTAFSVVNANKIQVTTAAHAAGKVDVVVQSPNGNGTLVGGFTYA